MINKFRILFLGAAYAQIPIIQEAKNRGWYIITCDYLPANPGHKLADESFNISTTDYNGVLQLAKQVNPDLVVAYASDPAAPTAAWVSEQLNLPGNPFKSVQTLSEKDLFRKFQIENGFNCPNAVVIKNADDTKIIKSLTFPIIIKPTDSSGSKGVSRVYNLEQVKTAIHYALSFSRNKRVIAEEYIDNVLGDVHGDGFVKDNQLYFCHLGDHIYNEKSNSFNPCGTTWPSNLNTRTSSKIKNDLQRLIKLSGFKNGPINIEARVNSKGVHYIMEIGPRSGGHFVPQAIEYSAGFNMTKAMLDILAGNQVDIPQNLNLYSAYYAMHSDTDGILKSIEIKPEIKPYIKEIHQYIKSGDSVQSFRGANAAIGVLLFLFETRQEMNFYIANINKYVLVHLNTEVSRSLETVTTESVIDEKL